MTPGITPDETILADLDARFFSGSGPVVQLLGTPTARTEPVKLHRRTYHSKGDCGHDQWTKYGRDKYGRPRRRCAAPGCGRTMTVRAVKP